MSVIHFSVNNGTGQWTDLVLVLLSALVRFTPNIATHCKRKMSQVGSALLCTRITTNA